MSTMTKVFVVLTAVLAIVLSCLTVSVAARMTNQKEQNDAYQLLAQSETVRRLNVEAVMATSLAMKDDTIQQQAQTMAKKDEELRSTSDELANLRIELARQSNERVAAEAGRKKLEEMLDVLTAEATSSQKQNQVLLTENIDLQTRNQRLAARVLELTSQTTILTDENRNLQEKLYAEQQRGKEVVRAAAAPAKIEAEPAKGVTPVRPPVAGPIKGEVVEVDGRYVSINIGETSGVVAGMAFMVYRGETYVGDLEVENVRPKEAGGKLTMVAPGQSVQRGDRVSFE